MVDEHKVSAAQIREGLKLLESADCRGGDPGTNICFTIHISFSIAIIVTL
jgi:hypothetical protein